MHLWLTNDFKGLKFVNDIEKYIIEKKITNQSIKFVKYSCNNWLVYINHLKTLVLHERRHNDINKNLKYDEHEDLL